LCRKAFALLHQIRNRYGQDIKMENPASLQFKSPDTESQPKPLGVETKLGKFERGKTPESQQAWLPPGEEFKRVQEVEEKFTSLIKEVRQLEGFIKKYQETAELHQNSRAFLEKMAWLHDICRNAQDQKVIINHTDISKPLEIVKESWITIAHKSSVHSLIEWLTEIDEAIQAMHSTLRLPNHRFIKSLKDERLNEYEKLYDDISIHIIHMNLDQGGIDQSQCCQQVYIIKTSAETIVDDFGVISSDLFLYIQMEIEIIKNRSQEISDKLIHMSGGWQ